MRPAEFFGSSREYMNRNLMERIVPQAARIAVRMRVCAVAGLLLLASLQPPAMAATEQSDGDGGGYQLGHGWQVPDTDLTVAGYAAGSLDKERNQPWTLETNSLSLFLWWQPLQRLKFFTETEMEDALTVRQRRTASDGAYLALER
ncbi:MAG TPA: hypothetical protein VNX47_10060, partial [Nevskia sp.]|nr:hypothetical protein [Nevskia sp.]